MSRDSRADAGGDHRTRIAVAVAVAGVVAYAAVVPLAPGPEAPGLLTRTVMALGGVAALVVVARMVRSRAAARIRTGLLVLGAMVLAYPTVLLLGYRPSAPPAASLVATLWHVLPLLLLQVLPVLACAAVPPRVRRRSVGAVVAVSVLTLAAGGLIVFGVVSPAVATWLGPVSTVVWIASFAVGPALLWATVHRSRGPVRRQTTVIAIAAVVPVLVITLCTTLGVAAGPSGLGEQAGIAVLLGGFSVSAALTTLLLAVGLGDRDGRVPRHAVVQVLAGLLTATTALVAACIGLAVSAYGGLGAAVGAAVLTTAALGWAATRLHRWAARVIDPVAELDRELTARGPVAEGEARSSLEAVLRRVVDDPELKLVVAAGADPEAGGEPAIDPGHTVVVARDRQTITAFARCHDLAAAGRLAALGDLSAHCRPALFEAAMAGERDRVAAASARADAAAVEERARLLRDMHDGVQGRLLGIALNLQLNGRTADDPAVRLLVDETVDALRGTVEDVRSLAGGRLPATLDEEGLDGALTGLVAPLGPLVRLDVTPTRFAPDLEATCYFVAAEGVANAVKHSGAARIDLAVDTTGDAVVVVVADDGVGGADPRLGSGLRGLSERVAASGGVLVVRAGAAGGTVLEATLPYAP